MTSQPGAATFRFTEGAQDFCALRSELIDALARLELAVSLCLADLGVKSDPRKTTFSQRVADLSKAKSSPRISTKKAAALTGLAGDCEPIKRLRASVVHGVMELGFRNGEPIAMFRNVADIVGNEPVCHALTCSAFQEQISFVGEMTRRVENSLNCPVSTERALSRK